MAQHPLKMKWKSGMQHGLSASQFGMALGFCGRIVDFVKYVRNIVGTELEFTGNASTSHGIATESKSRALYELLTGSPVTDGGFFLTEDKLLGCSPDGRIFCDANSMQNDLSALNAGGDSLGAPANTISVRIPFRQKREQQNEFSLHSPQCFSRQVCRRLLEIKSPFRCLYDGSKVSCQPFGIPLQYLCQMQGQMAIADVEECDFFVYLDRPACQVVAWRVTRSRKFWDWARPKLLQVVEWIRDGPPSWLDRRFEFEAFDFSMLLVEPLIFPYDITANAPIHDPSRFPFFERCPNPYREMAGSRSESDAVLRSLTSTVTRFLFHADADAEEKQEVQGEKTNKICTDDVLWCVSTAPSVTRVEEDLCWNSLHTSCNNAAVNEAGWGNVLEVVKPHDYDAGKITCRAHVRGGDVNGGKTIVMQVRYFQRLFLNSLEPTAHVLNASGKTLEPDATIEEEVAADKSVEHTLTLANSVVYLSQSGGRDVSESSFASVIIVDEGCSSSQTSSVEVIEPQKH